jgi:hypothetical protein
MDFQVSLQDVSCRTTIKALLFKGIIMFLQSLPTQDWGDHEVELLLSEAFLLSSVWHHAQSHFGPGSITPPTR